MREACDVVAELDVQRMVKAELSARLGDLLGGGVSARRRPRWIARKDDVHEKRHDDQSGKDENEQANPSD
jgi:hypothetical protein